MKKLLLGLTLILSTGCARVVPVKVTNLPKKNRLETRSDKYLYCITKLHSMGVGQKFIKSLCDSTYGDINE